MEIAFRHPFYLWALLIVPLIVVIHFISLNYSKNRAISFSNFVALERVSGQVGVSSNYSVLFIRLFIFISIVFAISGTMIFYTGARTDADYIIAIDASASMLAEDLEPTRIDAAKSAAMGFIDSLPLYSQVGVVSFAGTTYVNQPLTFDKTLARTNTENIQIIEAGGTDIGNAIITGTNLLINSGKPRVIIVLTDGRSNVGLSIGRAIEYSNDNNVIVNTIGIGTEEGYFVDITEGLALRGINEEELNLIANQTKGTYYNPIVESDLEDIYDDIAKSKKVKASLDLTLFLLMLTIALLSLEWILINTRFRIVP